MILSINDRLELNIECITQLCGINVQKKNNIIQNIVKYFSNTKYAEYEDKDDCVFKIDDEVVGRKYYTTYYIANISDLISNIQISKNSIMKKKWKVEANFSSSATISYMHGREVFWIAKENALILRQLLVQ